MAAASFKFTTMDIDNRSYVYLSLAFLVLVFVFRLTAHKRRLPPGPRPLPLIGNLLDMPPEKPWIKFAEWKKQYGDLVYLNVFGRSMLVLNSAKACNDLLDKRSAIYSDREPMTMTRDIVGWDFAFALMPYTPRWRRHRRVFHQYFNSAVTFQNHCPVQEAHAHLLLHRLLQSPEKFLEHVRLSFTEIIMKICYDVKVKDYDDPYVKIAETMLGPVLSSGVPGKFLVNLFPSLRHVPAWVPGAGFKRQAREWNKVVTAMRDMPFKEGKDRIDRGVAGPSVLASVLSELKDEVAQKDSPEKESVEDLVASLMSTCYAGGADTSVASTEVLFLTMANYPEAQKMAQAEIDAVVGRDRLPTFSDQKSLPCVNAIIKEILRWHTILPLSLPHASIEDDEYEGYFIPKGTSIYPNSWYILHDPQVYPDPEAFRPSRWLMETEDGIKLNPAVPDPTPAFGYGRRLCAGKDFGEYDLFIMTSNILACFDITPLDSSGRPTEHIDEVFTDEAIRHPLPFKVSIKPRSKKVELLVNEAVAGAD